MFKDQMIALDSSEFLFCSRSTMLESFLRWFQQTDVDTRLFQVRFIPQSGYSLFLNEDVDRQDHLLISIPRHLFICPQSTGDPQLTGFEQLIAYLLDSGEHPYKDFLRSIDPLPAWTKQQQTQQYPKFMCVNIDKHREKYLLSRNKFIEQDELSFQWAFYTVNTRSFHLKLNIDSTDADENLCLIPFLDLINHSNEPNAKALFNPQTNAYEVRSVRPIRSNEDQILFHYNSHSNIDLFIDYGFTLRNNIHNSINISSYLHAMLTQQDFDLVEKYDYWRTLEFYSGQYDIPWTIVKIVQLICDRDSWTPYDEPPTALLMSIQRRLSTILNEIRTDLKDDTLRWSKTAKVTELDQLFEDTHKIIEDTTLVVDRMTS